MNVIFMGTPDYAEKILEQLIKAKNINVVATYTQPDKPVGRKKVMTSPPVKIMAEANAIPVYQPARLRDETVVAQLQQIECDYIVVAAYGQILPKAILDHAPCINLHASILPQYRGASPIQQSLLNGDETTGVTAMLMDEGLDTGAILKTVTINIGEDEMVESLFDRLTALAADMTLDVLNEFSTLTPEVQDEKLSSHCTKISKADGLIAFKDAEMEYNKYRAFTPWPGIYLESGLKLKAIKREGYCKKNRPGEILEIDSDSVVVGCELGKLRIYTVQPPSKKAMSVIDYLNGKRLGLADTLA
ncbi:MAG: methionyl-tRNA formyltransferase [Campylobacterota bacterium]|nr:methionyl-tRNA formyltransferase [Campylobacterota bacterium]